jgi:predicted oxidoreductase
MVLANLAWPFKESKVEHLLDEISKYKSTINLALSSEIVQIMLIHNALKFRGDRMARCARLHRILDPKYGPLIAVRMNILTRKTLGGIQTNLKSQALRSDGSVFPGLYTASEAAGFGGGGVHGYNTLEGTFLTGCIFSGRAAGLAIAEDATPLAKL